MPNSIPYFIVIDDRRESFLNAKELALDEPGIFQWDLNHSRTIVEHVDRQVIKKNFGPVDINDFISYDEISLFFQSEQLPSSIALCLDLHLRLSDDKKEEIRNHYPQLKPFDDELIEGLSLLLAVLRNPVCKQLVIYVASVWTTTEAEANFVNLVRDENDADIEIHYIPAGKRHGYFGKKPRDVLKTVTKAWQQRFNLGPNLLVRDLLKVLTHENRNPSDPGHPNNDQQIARDICYYKTCGLLINSHNKSIATVDPDYNSYKALYHVPGHGYDFFDPKNKINVAILQELTLQMGIELNRESAIRFIKLPLFPGILFLIHLRHFMKSISSEKQTIELRGQADAHGVVYEPELWIQIMNGPSLKSALYEKGGQTASRLKALFFCKTDLLLSNSYIKNDAQKELKERIEKWPPTPILENPHKESRYSILVHHRFEVEKGTDYIVLYWGGDKLKPSK